jgi:hypothetical protein
MTYKMIETVDGQLGIQCLLCGLASFNYNDITNKYCDHCQMFHEDSPAIHTQEEILKAAEVIRLFKKYFN